MPSELKPCPWECEEHEGQWSLFRRGSTNPRAYGRREDLESLVAELNAPSPEVEALVDAAREQLASIRRSPAIVNIKAMRAALKPFDDREPPAATSGEGAV